MSHYEAPRLVELGSVEALTAANCAAIITDVVEGTQSDDVCDVIGTSM